MDTELIRIDRREPNGWCVNMHLVPLPDGGLLVHSPTWVGDDTFDRVQRHGQPRVLVAPNHYHHLSIRRFREHYPDALVVASEAALPRLAAKGHEMVRPSSEASSLLAPGMSLLACEGVKSGELWLLVDGGKQWLVGDAFFNVAGPVSGLVGLALRLTKTVPGLCLGTTFKWLGIADTQAYRNWFSATLTAKPPARLHFCHGDPLHGADVAGQLAQLVAKRLPG